jgi:class 3 adenylate cyclase/tetratricopeptide (TPR) repeat protein
MEIVDEPQPPRAREAGVRKTVTVLFSDLVDSTRLGDQLDPEAVRRLTSRYFESMRAVLERHGGIVEKYIGDAVMAVFGIPLLHEDDALRAVRAAADMRDALAALNDEFEQAFGLRLAARFGLDTGEVVAGDSSQGQLLVTGKAVNVAKRLEQTAAASEILLGESTRALVRNATRLAPIGAPALKGTEAIRAWRLLEVVPDAPALPRRLDAPLVGRQLELRMLRQAFDRVVGGRTGHLVTVLGAAGVGKSRLVNELVDEVGDRATVLRGRCLSYGEGVTYWPLAEVVREALGVDGQRFAEESIAAIAATLDGEDRAELIAERIAETLGVGSPGAGKVEETFWAARKLFEALARRRPLVVVFDDLHWAEPTFLDLVEHVADSRDAPILLVCIARLELLEERGGWGGGKLNAVTVGLEPLSDDECGQLIANLLDHVPVDAEVEARIADAADGNPLFAEELVAMLLEDELLKREGDRWVAAAGLSELPPPPSIHTLLAARLERLPDDEQAILGCASVEGAVFHRTALTALAPGTPREAVDLALGALFRKEVIRRDRASFGEDEAYRFRHGLIRDAAYRALPKSTRADLHERVAGWLEGAAEGQLREVDELIGYHLEQAFRCRVDLGVRDNATQALVARAAERLGSAGRRALARGDLPAATGLLERVASLLADDDPRRAAVLPELGASLIEAGRLVEAERVLGDARRLAAAVGDECADSHALVQQQFLQLLRVTEGGGEEAARAVERVVPVFERHADDHGLSRARRLEAWLHWNQARAAAAAGAWEQAAEHARRAGDDEERSEILNWIASSIFFGPIPVSEGVRRCDEILTEVSGNLASKAWTLRSLAGLHGMAGRFETARELLATSSSIFGDLGQSLTSSVSHVDGIVEMLAGDPAGAEVRLLVGYRALERMGDRAFRSTTAGYLAHAIYAQGRYEEASRFTRLSEELAAPDDVLTQILWRSARGKILAGQGRLDDAERLGREAVSLAELTDFVNTQAEAFVDLAQILHGAGRLRGASAAVTRGLELFERKGNTAAAGKTRADLAVLLRV